MEWVFVILMTSHGSVVMPDKYPASQCEQMQKTYSLGEVRCFSVPNPNLTASGCIVGSNKIDCYPLKKEQ